MIHMNYPKIKQTFFLIISFLSILMFNSCKKSDPVTPAPNYTNFKITNVKVNSIPQIDPNGNDWDLGGYPDIYFNMEDVNNIVLFDGSGNPFTNVTQLPISWNFTNSYQITNTSITHYVTVYDDDLGPTTSNIYDELIGYVGFKMDDYKSGYQTTITKTNGSLSVTITGVWY